MYYKRRSLCEGFSMKWDCFYYGQMYESSVFSESTDFGVNRLSSRMFFALRSFIFATTQSNHQHFLCYLFPLMAQIYCEFWNASCVIIESPIRDWWAIINSHYFVLIRFLTHFQRKSKVFSLKLRWSVWSINMIHLTIAYCAVVSVKQLNDTKEKARQSE